MSIKVRDIVSFAGRDYVVEGTASYLINGRMTVLARAVDGEVVLWIESPHAPGGGDRLLVLREVRDLELAVPPPESISYHDLTYVQRLVGRAQVDLAGSVPERRLGRWSSGATGRRAISTCRSRRASIGCSCSRANRYTRA